MWVWLVALAMADEAELRVDDATGAGGLTLSRVVRPLPRQKGVEPEDLEYWVLEELCAVPCAVTLPTGALSVVAHGEGRVPVFRTLELDEGGAVLRARSGGERGKALGKTLALYGAMGVAPGLFLLGTDLLRPPDRRFGVGVAVGTPLTIAGAAVMTPGLTLSWVHRSSLRQTGGN